MSPSRLFANLSTAIILMIGAQASAANVSYVIDPDHSDALFRTVHYHVGYYFGRFPESSGILTIDDAIPSKDSIEVSIDAESVQTGQVERDNDLMGPDILDVKQFPKLTFKSSSVAAIDANVMEVMGDLTIHGVTKQVTIKMEKVSGSHDSDAQRVDYVTQFYIKRSDFDMNMIAVPTTAISDEVTVILDIEAVKK